MRRRERRYPALGAPLRFVQAVKPGELVLVAEVYNAFREAWNLRELNRSVRLQHDEIAVGMVRKKRRGPPRLWIRIGKAFFIADVAPRWDTWERGSLFGPLLRRELNVSQIKAAEIWIDSSLPESGEGWRDG